MECKGRRTKLAPTSSGLQVIQPSQGFAVSDLTGPEVPQFYSPEQLST